MKNKYVLSILLVIAFASNSCGTKPVEFVQPELTPTPSMTPTITPTSTAIPTATVTPIGGGTGSFLFESMIDEKVTLPSGKATSFAGYKLYEYDLATSTMKIILTRGDVELAIGKTLYATQFTPSNDGKFTVIQAATEGEAGSSYRYEYYIATIDLSKIVMLEDTGAKVIRWIWSPNDLQVIGKAHFAASDQIYVVNNDGSGMKKLFNSDQALQPQWVENGKKITWLNNGDPMIYDTQTGTNEMIPGAPGKLFDLATSQDGKRIGYVTSENVGILSAADFITDKIDFLSGPVGCKNDSHPIFNEWSNDGTYVFGTTYFCMGIKGLLIPVPVISLAATTDGKTVDLKPLQGKIVSYCGWTPDNKFVFLTSEDEARYLVMVDIVGNSISEPLMKDPFAGSCPIWMK